MKYIPHLLIAGGCIITLVSIISIFPPAWITFITGSGTGIIPSVLNFISSFNASISSILMSIGLSSVGSGLVGLCCKKPTIDSSDDDLTPPMERKFYSPYEDTNSPNYNESLRTLFKSPTSGGSIDFDLSSDELRYTSPEMMNGHTSSETPSDEDPEVKRVTLNIG